MHKRRHEARILIVFVFLCSSGAARADKQFWSVERRVDYVDLIVIGKLIDVQDAFSINWNERRDGFGYDRWDFRSGLVTVDKVLKGEDHQGVRIAFWTDGYHGDNRSLGIADSDRRFREGSHGVWLLVRGTFVGFWSVLGSGSDGFMPTDSLQLVEEAIRNLERRK